MAYVACKRLKIGHEFREIGELVPEAETWRNLRVYLDNGSLAVVPNSGATAGDQPAKKKEEKKPKAAMAKPAQKKEEQAPEEKQKRKSILRRKKENKK